MVEVCGGGGVVGCNRGKHSSSVLSKSYVCYFINTCLFFIDDNLNAITRINVAFCVLAKH